MNTLVKQPLPTVHETRRYTVRLLQQALDRESLKMLGTYNVEKLRSRVSKYRGRRVTINFIVDVARSVNVKFANPPRANRKRGVYLATFLDKITEENAETTMAAMGVVASQAVTMGREAAIGDLGGQISITSGITPARVRALLPPPTIRAQVAITPERVQKLLSDGGRFLQLPARRRGGILLPVPIGDR